MGEWKIDVTSKPGVLQLRLMGTFSVEDMGAFVHAHNRAVDALSGLTYRVFADVRELAPLSPEASALLESAKAYSAGRVNFQGSAVLAPHSVVAAMQNRRTSISGGVMDTELVCDDEQACWEHLRSVTRQRPSKRSGR